MSGGSPAKALGTGIAIASVFAAPFTGGLTLAALPSALATASYGNRQEQSAARAMRNQQKDLMNSLNKPVTALPSMNSDAVQNQRINSLRSLQQRSGRASTLLTTQSPVKNTFG